jgi:hypothetical protein
MNAQGWWDELEAELLSDKPDRRRVVNDIKELLEAIEEGDDLPVPAREED